MIEQKLDVIGQTLDGHEDNQDAASVEGKQDSDAEEAVTRFLKDILEVVETYDDRMEAWQQSRSKKRTKNQQEEAEVAAGSCMFFQHA